MTKLKEKLYTLILRQLWGESLVESGKLFMKRFLTVPAQSHTCT